MIDSLVLLAFAAVSGFFLIPRNIVGIWMDPEFTGWVGPIASRLGGEHRLYADGLHSPMPPLAFVFMHLLYGTQATWIQERLWTHVFQFATVAFCYWALRLIAPRWIALASSLLALPVLLGLVKTILYDPFAQCLVAVHLLLIVKLYLFFRRSQLLTPVKLLLAVAPLSVCSALLVLTKQSTAAGCIFGAVAALILSTAPLGWDKARIGIAGYLLQTGLALVIFLFAISSTVSAPGFFHDVLISGSQPKGGAATLVANLIKYARDFIITAFQILVPFALLGFAVHPRVWLSKMAAVLAGPEPSANPPHTLAVVLSSVAGFLSFFPYLIRGSSAGVPAAIVVTGQWLLEMGLVLAVVWLALSSLRSARERDWCSPFALVLLIALTSAVGHSLSANHFRWTYDNNPLIVVVIAWLLYAASLTMKQLIPERRKKYAEVLTVVAASVFLCCQMEDTIKLSSAATESVPQIPYLKNALLRPTTSYIAELVKLVQRNAADANKDTVLLLPNDPNVEACFDRPRPNVTSAVLFVDQYWDSLVAEDTRRLKVDPPKVVIIGPGPYWIWFAEQWHKSWGIERLIERVKAEVLLPGVYDMTPIRIPFRGGEQTMEFYVRRN